MTKKYKEPEFNDSLGSRIKFVKNEIAQFCTSERLRRASKTNYSALCSNLEEPYLEIGCQRKKSTCAGCSSSKKQRRLERKERRRRKREKRLKKRKFFRARKVSKETQPSKPRFFRKKKRRKDIDGKQKDKEKKREDYPNWTSCVPRHLCQYTR